MDRGKEGMGGGKRVCRHCGRIAASGDVFCTSCGNDLRAAPLTGLEGSTDVEAFRAARGAAGRVEGNGLPVTAPQWRERPAGNAPPSPIYAMTGNHVARDASAQRGVAGHGEYYLHPHATWTYRAPKTDELAVASLVCAAASFIIPLFPAVAAVLLGMASRRRIADGGGAAEGEGLAVAGIILGSLNLVFCFLVLLIVVVALSQ